MICLGNPAFTSFVNSLFVACLSSLCVWRMFCRVSLISHGKTIQELVVFSVKSGGVWVVGLVYRVAVFISVGFFVVRCCLAVFRVCPESEMSSIRSIFLLFMGIVRGCWSRGGVFVWAMLVYDLMLIVVVVMVWVFFSSRSVRMRVGIVPPWAMLIVMSGW